MGFIDYLKEENEKDNERMNLIASENYISDDVKYALSCNLANKYAEGYPGKRYYGGCEWADEVELYCQKVWQKVFSTDYYVNVQPHSGSQANMAVYQGLLKPGDTVLSLSMNDGGHLTHGASVSFSGKLYNFVHYELDEDGYISLDDFTEKLISCRPKLVIAGASAYSREIPFDKMKEIIDKYFPTYFMVDMSHIAGLIATKHHISPFGYADVITTTTHKTLRGPRGGMIFSKNEEISKKINSAIFPGIQGGPHMNVIAAKAVCGEEVLSYEYEKYIDNVIKSSHGMAEVFKKNGFKVLTNGTDNHLFIVDLSYNCPSISGRDAEKLLEEYNILVNKNVVPNDMRKPVDPSGIRIGAAAAVTKGLNTTQLCKVAERICRLLKRKQDYIKWENKNDEVEMP